MSECCDELRDVVAVSENTNTGKEKSTCTQEGRLKERQNGGDEQTQDESEERQSSDAEEWRQKFHARMRRFAGGGAHAAPGPEKEKAEEGAHELGSREGRGAESAQETAQQQHAQRAMTTNGGASSLGSSWGGATPAPLPQPAAPTGGEGGHSHSAGQNGGADVGSRDESRDAFLVALAGYKSKMALLQTTQREPNGNPSSPLPPASTSAATDSYVPVLKAVALKSASPEAAAQAAEVAAREVGQAEVRIGLVRLDRAKMEEEEAEMRKELDLLSARL